MAHETDQNPDLPPAPEDILALELARGRPLSEAARTAGLSLSTAKRRAAEEGFRPRVDALRGELFDRASGQLAGSTLRAAQIILELAEDMATPAATRLAAARSILELARGFHETLALAARIEALEALRAPQPAHA